MKKVFTVLVFLIMANSLYCEPITLPVVITDGFSVDTLKFGLHPDATDGIDQSLGEAELPPMPPTGVFDARFIGDGIGIPIGQGVKKDLRQGTFGVNTIKPHRIRYQMGGSGIAITLRWNFPTGVSVHLFDAINGTIVSTFMEDTGSYVITLASVLTIMNFVVTYGPEPVELSHFWSIINSNDVCLKWTTGSEMNNRGFEVQRKNAEVEEWSVISFVNGAVNSNALQEYQYVDRSVNHGSYNYRLKQIDLNGNFEYFILSEVVNIARPNNFALFQNYPNPFNPKTTISFQLPKPGLVKLTLFDVNGRLVRQLISNEFRSSGIYDYQLDASELSSGTYYYSLESGNVILKKSMVLLK